MEIIKKIGTIVFLLIITYNYGQETKDSLEDEKKLEEVVVIGYGTAKKIDLTGSIATIKSSDIIKTPTGQAVQTLQGEVAGVQIISNGSPGDAPKINIRGVHSINGDNQPLYVVDGILLDNIDFLSPNDIKEFTILKDASSSAIYGKKAANGVVIVTTKGGSFNKPTKLTFSTFYGTQRATNVIKMANTEQFTNFAIESGFASDVASINAAIERYGRSRINPNLPDVNTDWYKEALRMASIQDYTVSLEGGGDKIAYSISGDFFKQEGILRMKNEYQKFDVHASLDAKAYDWLTVGADIIYTRAEKYDDEPSAWQQIYYAVPVLPKYDFSNTNTGVYPYPYADAQQLFYRDHQNPFSLMDNSDKLGTVRRTVLSAYADFSIIPKALTFKTSFSYNSKSNNERNMLLPYYVNDSYQRTIAQSSITRINAVDENYNWDNVLTYNKDFGKHNITLMAGSSYNDDSYLRTSIQGFFDPQGVFSRDNEKTWYLENTSQTGRISSDSGPYRYYGVSYFGRVSYKFDDKYIIYATLRNEGSNKYDEKRVNLPAVGVSWVASDENFLKNVSFLNLLKIRAGWGRLANNQVPPNRLRTATSTSTAIDDQSVSGFNFSTYSDNVNWEYTNETNIGLDAGFFSNRLSLTADYFIKDTENMLIELPPFIGSEISKVSIGEMRNKGFEITLGWKGNFSEDFRYAINGNFTTIKNEITSVGDQYDYIDTGMTEFQQRYAVGQPYKEFYGYEIEGVYQTQAEVDSDPMAIYANSQGAGTVKPGYFKYKDLDGNGQLDANDRTYIGSPVPTYYFGGSVALYYKNWDLSIRLYGQGGNVVLNRNRAEVIRNPGRNIDAELAVNRWHGAGTSDDFPSSEGYRQGWNQRNSKFWLEDGSFLRIQNIQLGYNLKASKLPDMRFTITVDRPFLFAKSKLLFNPEVNNDGVDFETYPTPAVFTFGYSVKF